ncbi:SH3-like domain-containing protein [Listeria grayi]
MIRKTDGIYSKGPHNTPGAKRVATSDAYYNFTLQVRGEIVTDNKRTWLNIYSFIGTSYKEVGWIDQAATEKQKEPYTYVDKPVSYDAVISKANDNIHKGDWNPVNGFGTEYDINGYISDTVHVNMERTMKSNDIETHFVNISKNGEELGWINPEHLTTFLTENSKVKQVENVIQKYLKLNGQETKINSDKFVEFAESQLLDDIDEDLSKRDDYDVITAYLSEYLHKQTSTSTEIEPPEGEQTESSVDLDEDLIEEPIIDDENLITAETSEIKSPQVVQKNTQEVFEEEK